MRYRPSRSVPRGNRSPPSDPGVLEPIASGEIPRATAAAGGDSAPEPGARTTVRVGVLSGEPSDTPQPGQKRPGSGISLAHDGQRIDLDPSQVA